MGNGASARERPEGRWLERSGQPSGGCTRTRIFPRACWGAFRLGREQTRRRREYRRRMTLLLRRKRLRGGPRGPDLRNAECWGSIEQQSLGRRRGLLSDPRQAEER